MNQEEKDTLVNVVRKYCNHVFDNILNTEPKEEKIK